MLLLLLVYCYYYFYNHGLCVKLSRVLHPTPVSKGVRGRHRGALSIRATTQLTTTRNGCEGGYAVRRRRRRHQGFVAGTVTRCPDGRDSGP